MFAETPLPPVDFETRRRLVLLTAAPEQPRIAPPSSSHAARRLDRRRFTILLPGFLRRVPQQRDGLARPTGDFG
jgi:hypothetical protein